MSNTVSLIESAVERILRTKTISILDEARKQVAAALFEKLTESEENIDESELTEAVRQTGCRHCDQDIENFSPYRKGEWRDRGNNTTCPSGDNKDKHHAPYMDERGRYGAGIKAVKPRKSGEVKEAEKKDKAKVVHADHRKSDDDMKHYGGRKGWDSNERMPWPKNYSTAPEQRPGKSAITGFTEDEMNEWGSGRSQFQDPGGKSALRKATKNNPRMFPCPTCKQENKLTAQDKSHGYQCNDCADREEGAY